MSKAREAEKMWRDLPEEIRQAVRDVLEAVSDLDAGWAGEVMAIAARLHCARLAEQSEAP